ncbi:MAG: class I mannose-6-phosphate isomerase [Clostridia bacterium]|nr:class I mannose-6-phosphate isomerase [Clostridia bacterium]
MRKEPIFFERNRVGRVYTGGKLFAGFFGDEAEDGFLPEEWIASAVKALNKNPVGEKEGVSKIKGSDMYFDDLLEQYPLEMLGSSRKMRILVKILDSAVRLPAQAHPDKTFSRTHFHSEYGKTESWIVLDTRPGAKIYFGFKDGVDKESFMAAIDESETDKDAMERLMEYTEPQVGDVYLIPAKTVHAIGAGCLILEVQEPTDFTIQPEHWCDAYKLNEQEMYIGLSKETAVDCFRFEKAPDTRLTPTVVSNADGVRVERVIGEADTDCFIINRITVNGGKQVLSVEESYGVYIVTHGDGELTGEGYTRPIKKGDYFFMPAILMGQFSVSGNVEIVECY